MTTDTTSTSGGEDPDRRSSIPKMKTAGELFQFDPADIFQARDAYAEAVKAIADINEDLASKSRRHPETGRRFSIKGYEDWRERSLRALRTYERAAKKHRKWIRDHGIVLAAGVADVDPLSPRSLVSAAHQIFQLLRREGLAPSTLPMAAQNAILAIEEFATGMTPKAGAYRTALERMEAARDGREAPTMPGGPQPPQDPDAPPRQKRPRL